MKRNNRAMERDGDPDIEGEGTKWKNWRFTNVHGHRLQCKWTKQMIQ